MPRSSSSRIHDWFTRRTFEPRAAPDEIARRLRRAGLRVTVCFPALDEERTVGDICASVRSSLMEEIHLVDELIVVDSGSADRTAEVAAEAGATVHLAADILPHIAPARGKGEALWKSLAVSQGDLIVWMDSDVENFDPLWIPALLEPLTDHLEIAFVKGYYQRPVSDETAETGGRVTEMLVRPLLHLLYPELSGIVQPLSGECAGRTSVLRRLPFVTGYGVDSSLLVDLVEGYGLDAIAQAHLGVRRHRNRSTLELGRMSHEILHALLGRLENAGRIKLVQEPTDDYFQLLSTERGPQRVDADPAVSVRPPLQEILDA